MYEGALGEPRTSRSHPVHISWLIPPELVLSQARMQTVLRAAPGADADLLSYIMSNPSSSSADDNRHLTHEAAGFVERLAVAQDETGLTGPTPVVVASVEDGLAAAGGQRARWRQKWMGNLCLSGCPGKKVRLATGPVNGRAMVNRDLDDDFARLRDFDVECSVCCLDDNELAFLGAPWPKYAAAAQARGVEVLRLPIVEGFPPASLAEAHALVREIDDRLMSGKNVLVHCRGGIGRAGVIACCVLLYKGLARTPARAVQLLRIRRSLKGIETPTQASFLIDYARWLHAARVAAATVPPAPCVYRVYSRLGAPSVNVKSRSVPVRDGDLRICGLDELCEAITTVKNVDQVLSPAPETRPGVPEDALALGNALCVAWVRLPVASAQGDA